MSVDWEGKFRALVRELEDIDTDYGIYPAAVKGCGEERDYEQRDGFKNGWNAAIMQYGQSFGKIVARASECVQDSDLQMLINANVGWLNDGKLSLNMNDTWAWACASVEPVPPEEVKEVARLFRSYGFAGLLYWVSKRNDDLRSEFHDINRMIDFVRNEEKIRDDFPSSSKRAFEKVVYTLGDYPEDDE